MVSGHFSWLGWRVMLPFSSENELMKTIFSCGTNLAIGKQAPHRRAVRRRHAVVVGAADAQIHFRVDDGEALRAPPVFHVLRIGEAFPQQLAWYVENP
jgi:hypothetical protein